MEDFVLKVLATAHELQGDSSNFVKDSDISHELQFDVNLVRNAIQILDQNEMLDVARTEGGLVVSVSARGRLSLSMEEFYAQSRKALAHTMALRMPVEIQESLQRLRERFKHSDKIAFLMMKFEDTPDHKKAVKAIKIACEKHGITAIRAEEIEFHSYLYWNIMTYIYACDFGIAVFDRITSNDFNPNVAYEVGYLTALGKPVCLLKDRTLTTLHTDLVGKLYRPFSTRDPIKSITTVLTSWLKERGLIAEILS